MSWTHCTSLIVAAALLCAGGCATSEQAAAQANAAEGTRAAMAQRATGTFEVTLVPQKPGEGAPPDAPGRMTIDKRFSGDLAGSSVGEMLSTISGVEGSAAYVAMERVKGTLGGRQGSFVLMHRGTMIRGAPELSVTVAPDSGTEGLEGLTGTMQIKVSPGGHDYVFDYVLSPAT